MKFNPKLPQYFEKLKREFQELAEHPDKEHLEQFKGDLKQFVNEINNISM